MLCQECGEKQATLHFTKIVNGEKTEFHICESCAREKGEGIPGTPEAFRFTACCQDCLILKSRVREVLDRRRRRRFAVMNADLPTPSSAKLADLAAVLATGILRTGLIRCSSGYMGTPFM